MLQLLRTRRWIGFTLLVIFVIIAFGLLSRWQWGRAEEKRLAQAQVDAQSAKTPMPLNASPPDEWTAITVHGTYDPASQVLVRQRPLDSMNGYWVLTALREDSGNVVWVNRGWLAASGPATTTPVSPAPPTGVVQVTGFWRSPEVVKDDARTGLPAGMVGAVDPAVLPMAGSPSGYVQASAPIDPALRPVPRPESDEGRNLSYAAQWLLFAVVAIIGWWFFLRREAAEDRSRVIDSQKVVRHDP